MKKGVCGNVGTAAAIKKYGYDYVEENFSALAAMTDDEFNVTANKYKEIGIPVLSTNGFFPGGFELYGDGDMDKAAAYVRRTMPRAASLGVKTVVIGSGRQRNIPCGRSYAECEEIFIGIVKDAASCAKGYGVDVVVEPLSYKETNFILTVSEGAQIARKTGADNVGVLVDFHHFSQNGERDDGLQCAADVLKHAHLARPDDDRLIPTSESDLPVMTKWAKMLRDINYTGNISLEGFFDPDFERTISLCRPLLDVFD